MKKIKRIVAAAVAAASIGAMNATASAEKIYTPPVNWIAVWSPGAPSSVNRTYYYPIYTYGNGYDITCDSFVGDYNRTVEAAMQYDINIQGTIVTTNKKIADLHAETLSAIYVKNPDGIYGGIITFSFRVPNYANCSAGGVLSQHNA